MVFVVQKKNFPGLVTDNHDKLTGRKIEFGNLLKGTVFQILQNSILSTSQMNIADICTFTLRDTTTVTGRHPAGPAQYLKPSWMILQEVISNLRLSL
jgi:hypothetical protein